MSIRDKIARFKQQNKDMVIDKQKEITKDAMADLFHYSPHAGSSVGGEATGKYDANHKVVVEGKTEYTPMNEGTGSEAVSHQLHSREINNLAAIEDVGETVVIENVTGYRFDVETGRGWEKTPGYYVYAKTIENLIEKFVDGEGSARVK